MSKFTETNKKIEETVVGGYKKIEDTVVDSYKKIEDKFVDTFLKNDNETIEQAKERIINNQKEIEEKNKITIENSLKSTADIQAEIQDKYGV